MALVLCRECGKEISDSAETCPNCGFKERNPSSEKLKWYMRTGPVVLWILFFWPVGFIGSLKNTSMKKGVKTLLNIVFGLWFCFLSLTIVIGVSSEGTSSGTVAAAPESPTTAVEVASEEKATLGLTVSEYVISYNQALRALENQGSLKITVEETSDGIKSLQLAIDENRAMIITADAETDEVSGIVFIGAGDGSVDSGVNVIMGSVATVMALENPNMSQDERAVILDNLGMLNGELMDRKSISFIRGNAKYFATFSEQLGVVVGVDPLDWGDQLD